MANSEGFQLFNDLINGHSVEQHIGETETGIDDDANNNDDDGDDDSGGWGGSSKFANGSIKGSRENMMMKEGPDHHSDDAIHDDQADQIQEAVDSDAAAVAKDFVEAVDHVAGVQNVQSQEDIAAQKARIGAQ